MRIVFLNASARNNGNTNELLKLISQSLDSNLFEIILLNISDFQLNFCLGCHECEKSKKCVQSDDIDVIYKIFQKSDIICLASPSYWGSITGQLKVFFDRSTPFCNTMDGKTIFQKGKKGISLSIRAGSDKKENYDIIKTIEHYFSHLEIDPIINGTFEKIQNKIDYDSFENKKKIETIVEEIINLEKYETAHNIG